MDLVYIQHLKDRVSHLGNVGELTCKDSVAILALIEIAESNPLSSAIINHEKVKESIFHPSLQESVLKEENYHPIPEPHNINT